MRFRHLSARLIGATCVLGAAASSSGGCAGQTPADAPTAYDNITVAQACSATDTMSIGSIPDFVASLTHGFAFSTLSIEQMNEVLAATHAIDTGDLRSAAQHAKRAGFRLVSLRAPSDCYLLLQPTDAAPPGQALLVYAVQSDRNLLVEAPHVPEDHRTDEQAALLFVRLRAKALVIAGAHRCAVTTPSGCKASTECGSMGVAVESDPAHSINNAVNAFHLAFRTTDIITLQLHTNFKPDLNGDILVSNGTHYAIPGTVADAFYAAMKAPGVDVRSCNDPSAPVIKGAFCGETNTQSLASNGAADQCLGSAASKGGALGHRFLHVEQNTMRMDSLQEWSARVGDALAAAIPLAH